MAPSLARELAPRGILVAAAYAGVIFVVYGGLQYNRGAPLSTALLAGTLLGGLAAIVRLWAHGGVRMLVTSAEFGPRRMADELDRLRYRRTGEREGYDVYRLWRDPTTSIYLRHEDDVVILEGSRLVLRRLRARLGIADRGRDARSYKDRVVVDAP